MVPDQPRGQRPELKGHQPGGLRSTDWQECVGPEEGEVFKLVHPAEAPFSNWHPTALLAAGLYRWPGGLVRCTASWVLTPDRLKKDLWIGLYFKPASSFPTTVTDTYRS